MKISEHAPDVIDFAYQIINLDSKNQQLRLELNHYKKMHELHCKDLKQRDKHDSEMTGIIFGAILNPESIINKGNKAILELGDIKKGKPQC